MSGDDRMTQIFPKVFFFWIVMSVLLTTGCVSQTGNPDIANGTPGINQSNNDPGTQMDLYRSNLTDYQKKIPAEILQISDPVYPKDGMSPESVRAFMVNSNQLRGDQVYLIIHLKPTASLSIVDPIASSVTSRNEEFNSVVAWVTVNNVSALASMDDVIRIRLVVPPEHSAGNIS